MLTPEVYQEIIRSRALVADEMARRQKNLNRSEDPELARLLKELDEARAALLALERSTKSKESTPEAIAQATDKMERAEAAVAQRSAAFRSDERVTAVDLDDVRRNTPKDSVLVSYVRFGRSRVESVDPLGGKITSYAAVVFHPDSGKLHIFDLGEASGIDPLIGKRQKDRGRRDAVRESWRESATNAPFVRPPAPYEPRCGTHFVRSLAEAKLLLVVPDGELNLIPFAAFSRGGRLLAGPWDSDPYNFPASAT